LHKSLEAGAHGYLSKQCDLDHIETAIISIVKYGFYFEPGLNAVIHEAIVWDKKTKDPIAVLSERELKIVKLVCKGYDNSKIANNLSLTVRTVESYRNRIIEKTEAKNFTNVILMAVKFKYVLPDELLI
jgi:DNA-binding NarL/FixJ family response regulator